MNQETPFVQGFNLFYRVVSLGDHYAIEVTKDASSNGVGLIKDGSFLRCDGALVRVSDIMGRTEPATILYRNCLGTHPEDQRLDRLTLTEFFARPVECAQPADAHRALIESKLGLGDGPMSVKDLLNQNTVMVQMGSSAVLEMLRAYAVPVLVGSELCFCLRDYLNRIVSTRAPRDGMYQTMIRIDPDEPQKEVWVLPPRVR